MSTRPRILIVECMQEISSFNPVLTHYENFHIERGEEIRAQEGLKSPAAAESFSTFLTLQPKGSSPLSADAARRLAGK